MNETLILIEMLIIGFTAVVGSAYTIHSAIKKQWVPFSFFGVALVAIVVIMVLEYVLPKMILTSEPLCGNFQRIGVVVVIIGVAELGASIISNATKQAYESPTLKIIRSKK